MLAFSPLLHETATLPIYLQLYQYIKEEIHNGTLKREQKLPSIRSLAIHLGVSRNTVDSAYQQLIVEGYINSKPKSGYYVAEIDTDLIEMLTNVSSLKERKVRVVEPSNWLVDFHYGSIDIRKFPIKQWKRWSNEAYDLEMICTEAYGDPRGERALRRELSDYLFQARGFRSLEDDIQVTSGTQQSLSLLCQTILAGKVDIAIEEPGYNQARDMFESHGFRVHPIPLEEDGLSIELLYKSKAKVVYTTPSHQFPCGMIMPVQKRLELVQWAKVTGGIIIEDDYDGEFRYNGKPIPPLKSLYDQVIYLGTFSKMLLPSLRMSFFVLPVEVYQELDFEKFNQTVPRVIQNTLSLFMKNKDWEKHVRRMRTLYQKKRDTLVKALVEHLESKVKIIGSDSGLHLLIDVKTDLSEEQLIKRAASQHVKVYSTMKYWVRQQDHNTEQKIIMLGFANMSIEEINQGIKSLKTVWFT